MEVFEAVRTVLAVRSYQDKTVPPDLVRRIIEAGRLTGSSMNRQPWHFIVVEDRDTLRQLGAVAQTGPYIDLAQRVCGQCVCSQAFLIRIPFLSLEPCHADSSFSRLQSS